MGTPDAPPIKDLVLVQLTAAMDKAWLDELHPPPHILIEVAEFVSCRIATWRRSFRTPCHAGQSGGDAQSGVPSRPVHLQITGRDLEQLAPVVKQTLSLYSKSQQQHASLWRERSVESCPLVSFRSSLELLYRCTFMIGVGYMIQCKSNELVSVEASQSKNHAGLLKCKASSPFSGLLNGHQPTLGVLSLRHTHIQTRPFAHAHLELHPTRTCIFDYTLELGIPLEYSFIH